jgi:hypothetical protein
MTAGNGHETASVFFQPTLEKLQAGKFVIL